MLRRRSRLAPLLLLLLPPPSAPLPAATSMARARAMAAPYIGSVTAFNPSSRPNAWVRRAKTARILAAESCGVFFGCVCDARKGLEYIV